MAVFEVSRQVKRRCALAAELPTDHPAELDKLHQIIDALPDPETLYAESRGGVDGRGRGVAQPSGRLPDRVGGVC